MTWSCRKVKVTVALSIWLWYSKCPKGFEDKKLEEIDELFEKGNLEEAIQGFPERNGLLIGKILICHLQIFHLMGVKLKT